MRMDGRKLGTLRDISVRTDYIKYAEGSCLIEAGDTKVVCTASVEDGVPPFLRGKGSGWVTSEYSMLPRSCQTRVTRESSKGKKGGRTHEIQRLIGRALRGIVDLERIGERTIWIDCDVIQADGGTRCTSINGSFIALCFALNAIRDKAGFDKLPITNMLAAVSVGIIGGKKYLDLNYGEDFVADVDMNVVMTSDMKFVEVQGTAEKAPFSAVDLNDLIVLASSGIKKIFKKQKEILKGVL